MMPDVLPPFFFPGPTAVHPEVLAAQLRPMIPHRGAEFRELMRGIQEGLAPLLGTTTRPIVVAGCAATGLMEGAVRGLPPGPLLVTATGAFAERFARIALLTGREVDALAVPPGAPADPDAVRAAFARRRYAGLAVVHVETSTGARSDVATLARIARAHDALVIVDGVTSVGGMPVHADAWDVDVLLTASQKALACPPGLAMAALSDRWLARTASVTDRGLYLDLEAIARASARHEPAHTPPVSVCFALATQLARIATEGVERRFARHERLAAVTDEWLRTAGARLGLALLTRAEARATTVSVISVPPAIGARRLVAAVAERGVVIGGGYGAHADTTVRIGHMGDHDERSLRCALDACEEAADALAASAA